VKILLNILPLMIVCFFGACSKSDPATATSTATSKNTDETKIENVIEKQTKPILDQLGADTAYFLTPNLGVVQEKCKKKCGTAELKNWIENLPPKGFYDRVEKQRNEAIEKIEEIKKKIIEEGKDKDLLESLFGITKNSLIAISTASNVAIATSFFSVTDHFKSKNYPWTPQIKNEIKEKLIAFICAASPSALDVYLKVQLLEAEHIRKFIGKSIGVGGLRAKLVSFHEKQATVENFKAVSAEEAKIVKEFANDVQPKVCGPK
jgi:hypothetical protein